MKFIDLGALLLLASVWGASFLFIRVAAPAIGPIALVDARVFLAGGVLLACALALRTGLNLRRWKHYLVLGTVNAALPFTLIAAAELALTASFAAILNATTPLFTALFAAVWLGHSLTWRRLTGLALGLVGVAVSVGWNGVPVTGHIVLAVCASLAAALCYGIGFVYSSRGVSDIPSITLSAFQQIAAGIVLLPLAAFKHPTAWPSGDALSAALALSLIGTAFAYLLYFRLVRRIGPTSTSTVTFLVPLFGLLWSVLFLRETVGPGLLAGLVLILASITLVTGIPLRQRVESTEIVSELS